MYKGDADSVSNATVKSRVSCSMSVLCVFCDACMPFNSSCVLAVCVMLSIYCTLLRDGNSSSMVYTVIRPNYDWFRDLLSAASDCTVDRTFDVLHLQCLAKGVCGLCVVHTVYHCHVGL